jgi:hypothetical protein
MESIGTSRSCWWPVLTPSRPENKTAGNERDRIGTRWSGTAGLAVSPQGEAGVRIPLAPDETTS